MTRVLRPVKPFFVKRFILTTYWTHGLLPPTKTAKVRWSVGLGHRDGRAGVPHAKGRNSTQNPRTGSGLGSTKGTHRTRMYTVVQIKDLERETKTRAVV